MMAPGPAEVQPAPGHPRLSCLVYDIACFRLHQGKPMQEILRSAVGGNVGEAYLELARAAVAREAWAEADQAAQRALEAAMRTGDEEAREATEEILRLVWLRCGGMRRLKCG